MGWEEDDARRKMIGEERGLITTRLRQICEDIEFGRIDPIDFAQQMDPLKCEPRKAEIYLAWVVK